MTLELEPRAGTRSLPIAPRHDGEARHVATRLQAALKTRPSYADLRFLLGMALARAGRDVEAEIELERALRINADYLDARLWLARLRLDRGEWRRPRRDLERGARSVPGLSRSPLLARPRTLPRRRPRRHAARARARGRPSPSLRPRPSPARAPVPPAGRSAEGLRALRLGFARDREAPGAANLRGLCARAREEPERVEAEVRRALYQARLSRPARGARARPPRARARSSARARPAVRRWR